LCPLGWLGAPLARDLSAFELLRRPAVTYARLAELTGEPDWAATGAGDDRVPAQVRGQVEVRAKYAGYIQRQQADIQRAQRAEQTALPRDFNYADLAGLSTEVRQKLSSARPATIGAAARIPGITPAAVQILVVHLKKRGVGRKQVA
jgi:tRNA uridine 5-carboxymethylaminomethyl modification enzyme